MYAYVRYCVSLYVKVYTESIVNIEVFVGISFLSIEMKRKTPEIHWAVNKAYKEQRKSHILLSPKVFCPLFDYTS